MAAWIAEFEQGLAERRGAIVEAAADAAPERVAGELAARRELDQYARTADDPLRETLTAEAWQALQVAMGPLVVAVDEENTLAVKRIVDQHGWPTISGFGKAASFNAWLLVQHADRDPAFQAEMLGLMGGLAKRGEVRGQDYALLWDRVAIAAGHPQRYGSQGSCVGPSDWDAQPVERPRRLDALRAAVGLEPMGEYDDRLDLKCANFVP